MADPPFGRARGPDHDTTRQRIAREIQVVPQFEILALLIEKDMRYSFTISRNRLKA